MHVFKVIHDDEEDSDADELGSSSAEENEGIF